MFTFVLSLDSHIFRYIYERVYRGVYVCIGLAERISFCVCAVCYKFILFFSYMSIEERLMQS